MSIHLEQSAVSLMRNAFAAYEYGEMTTASRLAAQCREVCESLDPVVARSILGDISHIR